MWHGSLRLIECARRSSCGMYASHSSVFDQAGLHLVSSKLYDLLLSPPPGEGLWGDCSLSVVFTKSVDRRADISPEVRE